LAGIAIKPKTPANVLFEVLDSQDKEEVPDVSFRTISFLRKSYALAMHVLTHFPDGTRHDCRTRIRWSEIHARHDAKGSRAEAALSGA